MSRLNRMVFSITSLLSISVAILVGMLVFVVASELDLEIKTAVIVTSGTVLVSVISLIASRAYERRAEQEQRIRQEKIEVYEKLMDFYFSLFRSVKDDGEAPDFNEFFATFSPKFLIWAPDHMVARWGEIRLRTSTSGGGDPDYHPVRDLGELIMAIREDIGHEAGGLKLRELYAVWINDPDSVPGD